MSIILTKTSNHSLSKSMNNVANSVDIGQIMPKSGVQRLLT